MKKHIPTITISIIIIGVIALGVWYSDRNSPINELVKLNVYSEEELSFLEEEGFLDNIDSENLPSDKEQIISLLKSSNLIEQNLNSPDESFEVLATKLDDNTYQLAFKLENKSNQSKEFYLIPISESSQTEFKEIKGVVKDGDVSWGNQGDWGYDIEKHKQELRPELARAYDDIETNGYTGKPIKLVLEANSTLLAQSKWEIRRESISTDLEPIYLLVYGSAGGVKDGLTILTVHSSPQQGENWEVSFTTRGTADLTITPDDQATIDDMDFISLKCGDKERTPQILENDVIFYPNWFCFEEAKVVHIVNIAAKHTLKFQFGEQTAYAYNNPGLIDDLVSYWRLDESSGDAIDVHANNDGTVTATSPYGAAGKINTAYDFDGDEDYVDVGTMGSFAADDLDEITSYSMWVKSADTSNEISILGTANDGDDTWLEITLNSDSAAAPAQGRVRVALRDENMNRLRGAVDSDTGITDGDWHHLAVVGDTVSDVVYVYVDNVLKTFVYDKQEHLGNAGNFEYPLIIGAWNNRGSLIRFFNGTIDELAIWDRALDADEVSDLYNAGHGLAYPFNGIVRGVVSHWKLDDNLDTSAVIDIHNTNPGTVVNNENSWSSDQSAAGKINTAFDFGDDGDYVQISNFMNVAPTSEITISVWAYLDNGSSGSILRSELTGAGQRINVQMASTWLTWDFGSGSGTDGRLVWYHDFQYDTWYHWVFVSSDSESYQEIYRNGVREENDATALTLSQYSGYLGISSPSASYEIGGLIDEVTIWNRALTQTEITVLYNSGNGLAYPFDASVRIKGGLRVKGGWRVKF